jgi:hypothetical protein
VENEPRSGEREQAALGRGVGTLVYYKSDQFLGVDNFLDNIKW